VVRERLRLSEREGSMSEGAVRGASEWKRGVAWRM